MEDCNDKLIINIGSTSWMARKGGGAAVVREFIQHLDNTNQNYINLEVHNYVNRQDQNWFYAKVTDSLLHKNIKLLQALRTVIKESTGRKYVITHNIPVFILSFIWIKFKRKITHIHYFHGPAYLEAREEGVSPFVTFLIKIVELTFYFSTRRLIFLSDYFQTLFKKKYFSKINSVIVPYSIAKRPLPKIISKPQYGEKFKLLSVRRLQKRMGLDILIKACNHVRNEFELDIVGIGPEQESLSNLIEYYGLNHKVRLCGRVSDKDLNKLISNCNLTVMPTRSLEGFGISIIDSLVLGVPVLAFKVGGMPEIIEGLSNSLIVEELSEITLAQRLDDIIEGKIKLPSAELCRKYVEDNYTDNFTRLISWIYTF